MVCDVRAAATKGNTPQPSPCGTPTSSAQNPEDRELLLKAMEKIEALEGQLTIMRGQAETGPEKPLPPTAPTTAPSTPGHSQVVGDASLEDQDKKKGAVYDDTIVTPDSKQVTCSICPTVCETACPET